MPKHRDRRRPWEARTVRHGTNIFIGTFHTYEEAFNAEINYRRSKGWPVNASERGKEGYANSVWSQ